jgi:hypothetical protein
MNCRLDGLLVMLSQSRQRIPGEGKTALGRECPYAWEHCGRLNRLLKQLEIVPLTAGFLK